MRLEDLKRRLGALSPLQVEKGRHTAGVNGGVGGERDSDETQLAGVPGHGEVERELAAGRQRLRHPSLLPVMSGFAAAGFAAAGFNSKATWFWIY
jgi:hypothetical protein